MLSAGADAFVLMCLAALGLSVGNSEVFSKIRNRIGRWEYEQERRI